MDILRPTRNRSASTPCTALNTADGPTLVLPRSEQDVMMPRRLLLSSAGVTLELHFGLRTRCSMKFSALCGGVLCSVHRGILRFFALALSLWRWSRQKIVSDKTLAVEYLRCRRCADSAANMPLNTLLAVLFLRFCCSVFQFDLLFLLFMCVSFVLLVVFSVSSVFPLCAPCSLLCVLCHCDVDVLAFSFLSRCFDMLFACLHVGFERCCGSVVAFVFCTSLFSLFLSFLLCLFSSPMSLFLCVPVRSLLFVKESSLFLCLCCLFFCFSFLFGDCSFSVPIFVLSPVSYFFGSRFLFFLARVVRIIVNSSAV